MLKTLNIMIGIQGSGKSTFCKSFFASNTVRINLDELKTRHREKTLFENSVAESKCIVIDNTNPTVAEREKYIAFAKASGYKIVGYFMQSILKDCIERNEQRTGKEKIPRCAIAATSNKLQMPSYCEGFDEIYFVKNDGNKFTVEKWKD